MGFLATIMEPLSVKNTVRSLLLFFEPTEHINGPKLKLWVLTCDSLSNTQLLLYMN